MTAQAELCIYAITNVLHYRAGALHLCDGWRGSARCRFFRRPLIATAPEKSERTEMSQPAHAERARPRLTAANVGVKRSPS
ncbi:hypothetical protein PUN4_510004 [Paraburkholderia unamae]|nr:hypothetical protein PUN4_510004 [Paraburkholderia unamae]